MIIIDPACGRMFSFNALLGMRPEGNHGEEQCAFGSTRRLQSFFFLSLVLLHISAHSFEMMVFQKSLRWNFYPPQVFWATWHLQAFLFLAWPRGGRDGWELRWHPSIPSTTRRRFGRPSWPSTKDYGVERKTWNLRRASKTTVWLEQDLPIEPPAAIFLALQAGKAIFTNPSTAVNCGGAPQKIAYLAEAKWRERGRGAKWESRWDVAVGQNLRYLFGDYPPKVV